jgi:hypothetical protein
MAAVLEIPLFLKEAYLDDSPIVVIKAGRRIGKTKNWVTWIIQQLDEVDPTRIRSGLWVDTKHPNIDKYIDRYFKPTLSRMNHWDNCHWNQQKKVLTLWNKNYIDFGSAERPELMEGFGYDVAVLNEGGIIFKKRSLWENTLFPMLKGARTRIIGTPKGKNTFESLYTRYPHYSFSAYDSPFWTAEQIEEAKRTMTQEAFRQEILAEFIEGSGAVFRNIEANAHGSLLEEPTPGKRYVFSGDLAKHSDFTVLMVGDLDTRQVVYHDRFNQLDWGLQKDRIINAYKKFGCISGVIDATGVGDAIFDDLRNQGLNLEGFKFTSSSKQELISNLSVAMDNKDISYPHIEELTDELSIFAYEQRANGQFAYSAPEGFNDDEVIALALLNRAFSVKEVEWGGMI